MKIKYFFLSVFVLMSLVLGNMYMNTAKEPVHASEEHVCPAGFCQSHSHCRDDTSGGAGGIEGITSCLCDNDHLGIPTYECYHIPGNSTSGGGSNTN